MRTQPQYVKNYQCFGKNSDGGIEGSKLIEDTI